MIMKKNLTILFLVLIIFSCKEKTINISKDITFDKQMDVSYGNDSEQKLDLYIPKTLNKIKIYLSSFMVEVGKQGINLSLLISFCR